jgi:hypothetical protein
VDGEGSRTVSQPEEIREKSPKTDAVLHPPTANPDRTQLRAGRDEPDRDEPDRVEDDQAGNPSTSRKER